MIKHKTVNKGAYRRARNSLIFPLALSLSACLSGPAIDLAPDYKPEQFIVPDSWEGAGPFAKANPSEGELRLDWWRLYNDPVLNEIEKQAMIANPDLHAAAERFVQARDMMMKTRSRLIPHLGVGFDASGNKQSEERLFRGIGENTHETTLTGGGIASWEPDFWSRIRNATRIKIYRAEQVAAEYILARLSLQAEIAENYYILRGLDAKKAIYEQSIAYYSQLLDVVKDRFVGALAPRIDVTRTQYLLYNTQARILGIRAQRQVVEHALAILANRAPSSFAIEPVSKFPVINFQVPVKIPSTLLERRPDIAAMERKMAQANRVIGIARAAFYPHIFFAFDGGFEGGTNLFKLANSLWSYGLDISLPIFTGGERRAELQMAWSEYRETVDEYRSTVLNAFREVENSLSRTTMFSGQVDRLAAAVGAARATQDLTTNLYTGGLANSLELLMAQIQTLDARIDLVEAKTERATASVALVRSLGGGWNRKRLPADDQIQPFNIFQYTDLGEPKPAGGVDVPTGRSGRYSEIFDNLTKPTFPAHLRGRGSEDSPPKLKPFFPDLEEEGQGSKKGS